MCLVSPPSPRQAAAAPPAPPPQPQSVDPKVTQARRKDKQTAALAQGRSSTILTSGLGLTTPVTGAKKTLLGS